MLVVVVGGWLLVLAVYYGLLIMVVVFGYWMASLMWVVVVAMCDQFLVFVIMGLLMG